MIVRSFKRYDAKKYKLKATITYTNESGEKEILLTQLLNLSVGGLQITSKRPLDFIDKVVKIDINIGKTQINLTAQSAWKIESEGNGYFSGFKLFFDDVNVFNNWLKCISTFDHFNEERSTLDA